MSPFLDNINKIRYRIRAAAEKAGRDPDRVRLVVVSKYAPLEAVRRLLESGFKGELGENRVQEAQAKKEALGALGLQARWRLIGHLQTNKAKRAAELFDAVDSVDSLKLALALERALAGQDRRLPVLVQARLSARESQSGAEFEQVGEILAGLKACPHLEAKGLMAIAPMLTPVEAVRPEFKRLRALFDRHFGGRPGAELSMGMSRDFEIAVEEGATLVRIGSLIFS